MFITNENKKIFKKIKNINDIKVCFEELEFDFFVGKDGITYGYCSHGEWAIKINNKIYAKYNTEVEAYYIVKQLIQAFNKKTNIFVFPDYVNVSDVLEVL